MKVLVADHEIAEAARLRLLLEELGADVVTAHTGAEALSLAETEQPYLAILDTELPDMSGLEVLRQIRFNPRIRQIGVMLANPNPNDADIIFGFRYCSDAHWQRPLDEEDLKKFMERLAPGAEVATEGEDRFIFWKKIWDAERDGQ